MCDCIVVVHQCWHIPAYMYATHVQIAHVECRVAFFGSSTMERSYCSPSPSRIRARLARSVSAIRSDRESHRELSSDEMMHSSSSGSMSSSKSIYPIIIRSGSVYVELQTVPRQRYTYGQSHCVMRIRSHCLFKFQNIRIRVNQ